MRSIDGRAIAKTISAEVSSAATQLSFEGITPTLAVVVPTRDESTAWYVRSIERTAARVGVTCRTVRLEDPSGDELARQLDVLSRDDSVHGIICQTPLPNGVTLTQMGEHIDVDKDIDGANPASLGRLAAGVDTFAPATAAAVTEILRREEIPLAGKQVVIVGRSTVVGKPAALLLLNENATVTVCHSRTEDLAQVCARADVVVAAVGKAHMITREYVAPGAVVIDVGTNPTDDGLVGDVDLDSMREVISAATPVPGGVGPVTTIQLMQHTVRAAANV
ncbi:MAG TPA: bifunctional 5,10-methylenetetrahydrofolate dehydrogenase/5,10-methenyltetrahydrofolate cyclohydrolase [Candidatus Stackebrandtia faecavium]|nr:bifunctional 5,10-methylenetetrahydrofolate dehydrogenase/5,10-methenyltetrahydrofolate cyclohydrolase [Candidatus Stackebrandtia faecavium]